MTRQPFLHKRTEQEDLADADLALPEEEHSAGSGEGLEENSLVVNGLSRFMKAARAPQKEDEKSEEDKDELGQDDCFNHPGDYNHNTAGDKTHSSKPSTPKRCGEIILVQKQLKPKLEGGLIPILNEIGG